MDHNKHCSNIEKLEAALDTYWDLVRSKASTKVILIISGVMVSISLAFFGGTFSLLYNQGESIREDLRGTNKVLNEVHTEQVVQVRRLDVWIENAPPPHHHTEGGVVIRDR